jgi:hypothetical protein
MTPRLLLLVLLLVGCGSEVSAPDDDAGVWGCCVFGGSPGDQTCGSTEQECLDTHVGEWVTGPSCTSCDPANR